MKKFFVIASIALLTVWAWVVFSKDGQNTSSRSVDYKNDNNMEKNTENQNLKTAYVAGWCFWCIESIFDGTEGVISAISGYIGGSAATANYKSIWTGNTKHREWVKIIYDPDVISYWELIDIFWRQIDPTDDQGQFADKGFQYTTAMYYSNDEEKDILENSKKKLSDSGKFEKEIATKILPVSDFYEAEEEHQDYAQKQTLRYKAYEIGSGRAWYKKETWADETASFTDAESPKNLPDFTNMDLKERLTPLQYKVTQKNGTERAFSEGNYHDNKQAWIYLDIIDGTPLYASIHKYDSGTWWPSFWKAIDDDKLVYREDNSLFSKRIELRSKKSDSHLGHIFPDGPQDKWGMRHCINGASLYFVSYDDLEETWYGEYKRLFNND